MAMLWVHYSVDECSSEGGQRCTKNGGKCIGMTGFYKCTGCPVGVDLAEQNNGATCEVRGYCSVGDCGFQWGQGGGFCGIYRNGGDPNRWIHTCDCLDALTLSEGCSIEVRTGDGLQYTYHSSVVVCGYEYSHAVRCGYESRDTPGCDSVRSLRIFDTSSGDNCADGCAPNPCLNHGACVDTIGGYYCECRDGIASGDGLRVEQMLDSGWSDSKMTGPMHGPWGNNVRQVSTHFRAPLADHAGLSISNGCQITWRSWSMRSRDGEEDRLRVDGQIVWRLAARSDCSGGWTRHADSSCYIDVSVGVPCVSGGMMIQFESDIDQVEGDEAWGFSDVNVMLDVPESGDNCADGCAPNPCLNHGTCVDMIGSHECICTEGIASGDNCADECTSNPCQNDGGCVDLAGSYMCDCPEGLAFGDDDCVDNCESDPCAAGHGICVDLVGQYRCDCADGYIGQVCQREVCDSSPCRNGATCVSVHTEFECRCTSGYAGEYCEISCPCLNGI